MSLKCDKCCKKFDDKKTFDAHKLKRNGCVLIIPPEVMQEYENIVIIPNDNIIDHVLTDKNDKLICILKEKNIKGEKY